MIPASLILSLCLKAEAQLAGQTARDIHSYVKVRRMLDRERAERIRTLGEWVSTIQDINSLPEVLED